MMQKMSIVNILVIFAIMFVAYQEVQAAKSGDGSVQRQPTGGFWMLWPYPVEALVIYLFFKYFVPSSKYLCL